MQQSTIDALNALNHAFYESIADEWQASRKAPWPGFARVLDALPTTPRSVLDVGAGDGRFGAFLSERAQSPAEYLGVDASEALLQRARARGLGTAYGFAHADFVRSEAWEPERRFSLIVLFGVLHHVPSQARREQLVRRLASRLEPGGCLALTFWRLHQDPRFERRVLPVSVYNETATPPIPHEDLEPGDTLLHWGSAGAPPRYCHFPDDAEIAAVIAATQLRVLQRFVSDGRGDALNEYVILQASE